jgi:hypothetical protein
MLTGRYTVALAMTRRISPTKPCESKLRREALRAYIDAAGIGADKKGFMFPTSRGHGGTALADQAAGG